MCTDLKEPNEAVVTDCYPIPHIKELFSELKVATMFSTIKLASAYYQVPLHEDIIDLTAFISEFVMGINTLSISKDDDYCWCYSATRLVWS